MHAQFQTLLFAWWYHSAMSVQHWQVKLSTKAIPCHCACGDDAPCCTGWSPAGPPAPPWCWDRAASGPATPQQWCRQCRRQPQTRAACLLFGLQSLILQAAMGCWKSSIACMQENLGSRPKTIAARCSSPVAWWARMLARFSNWSAKTAPGVSVARRRAMFTK